MDKEILELLQKLVKGQEETNARLSKVETRLDKIETRLETVEAEQKETNKRLDNISKGIGKLVSYEIGDSISEIKSDINDIKTEVEIIKLSVGEHEMDIKYLKKVK